MTSEQENVASELNQRLTTIAGILYRPTVGTDIFEQPITEQSITQEYLSSLRALERDLPGYLRLLAAV